VNLAINKIGLRQAFPRVAAHVAAEFGTAACTHKRVGCCMPAAYRSQEVAAPLPPPSEQAYPSSKFNLTAKIGPPCSKSTRTKYKHTGNLSANVYGG